MNNDKTINFIRKNHKKVPQESPFLMKKIEAHLERENSRERKTLKWIPLPVLAMALLVFYVFKPYQYSNENNEEAFLVETYSIVTTVADGMIDDDYLE